MALAKVVYVNGVTVITAENLNEIQDAIIALEEAGGGTTDYNDLTNKPSIGGVTLTGNKSLSDLGIAAATAVPAAATATPASPGVAAVGTSTKYAREDHVHPFVVPSSDDVTWEGGDLGQVTAPTDVTGAVEAVYDAIPTTAADVGAIAAPASPATGAFLVWSGSAWVAQTLATWQAGSY